MRSVLVSLISLVLVADAAKILGVIPTPSYSHQIAFRSLWSELSLRGHEVTVITTHPVNNGTLKNLKEVDISFVKKYLEERYEGDKVLEALNNGVMATLKFIEDMLIDTSNHVLDHKGVREIMKQKNGTYDVVLVESLFPEMNAFGDLFGCPVIGVISLDAPANLYGSLGNPTHPAVYPDVVLPFSAPLTFSERVVSTIYNPLREVHRKYSFNPRKEEVLRRHFPTVSKSYNEVYGNMEMVFVNSHPVLQGVRPLGPSIVTIGGTTNIETPKPLPKDLKQFMDEAKEGVIYFSLGSNVKSKNLSDKLRRTLISTLGKLSYNVLWKFETNMTDLPQNIKIISWAPQQDILRHPNVKLFITQGGLQSLQEAIMYEVPLVVFPFFGDQAHNARIVENRGLGKRLVHSTLEAQEFERAVVEVITNKKYKDNVIRMKTLILDEPMSGVEKAVWWTEYVIRHKGAKHFRDPILDLSLLEYYQIDVYAFLTVVTIFVLFTFYYVFNVVCRLLNKLLNRNKKLKEL